MRGTSFSNSDFLSCPAQPDTPLGNGLPRPESWRRSNAAVRQTSRLHSIRISLGGDTPGSPDADLRKKARKKAGQVRFLKRKKGARKRDRFAYCPSWAMSVQYAGNVLLELGFPIMPRTARHAPGGMVFHVLNRGVGRMQLFDKPADYTAFESVLAETHQVRPMRICAYCVMPNHWHLLLWPENDGDLGRFMQRLTITHARRWQEHRHQVGHGHVYQGRFKSFPVEDDEHFYPVARYIERNALRANLVDTAEQWRWGSLRRRTEGETCEWLHPEWPVAFPDCWTDWVNEPQTEQELAAIRRSVDRGRPFGNGEWVDTTARDLCLENTMRAPHRPRKVKRS